MLKQFPKQIKAIPERNKKDIVGEGAGMRAIKATDIEYIEDRSYKAKVKGFNAQYIWGGFLLLCFLVFQPYKSIVGLLIFMVFGVIFGYQFLLHYISPKKYFIANRQTGKLRVPTPIKKPEVWIDFNKGFAFEKTAYLDNFYTSLFFQTNPEVKPGAVFGLADFAREDYWNFLVWYMDKNRPLPPGTAFDPYRQRDFERRKAEGFPKPLYPSTIKTPEASKEQQAERRRIGGW